MTKIWHNSKKATINNQFLEELIQNHEELSDRINKNLMTLKSKGHNMGIDLRNKHLTEILVPNSFREFKNGGKEHTGIMELKTLRIDHRITSKLMKLNDKELSRIIHDDDHLDQEFAKLAILCKEMIKTSKTLKRVEKFKGKILRSSIFSIKHDDNLIEYY